MKSHDYSNMCGKDLVESLRKDNLWGNIRRCAKTDPALQEQLDKIVVYYRLKYEQRRR
jgi:hypothetical protein